MSDAARPQWAGQRAMSWVIDDAPVPTALFPVLMVIARRCDENGRGSYQSVPTIAEKTGKSQDQVKRDIRELKKVGLLVEGDLALVKHLPEWKRPAVYDLPLHISGPKPLKESKNKTGGTSQGGGMDAPRGMDATGWHSTRQGGGMDALGGGGMDAPQTKPLKNKENNPSLSPREDEHPPAATVPTPEPEREIDIASQKPGTEEPNPIRRLLLDAGCPTENLDEVADELVKRHDPRSPAWWRTVAKNGDLPDLVAEVVDALQPVQLQLSAEHIANAHEFEPRTDGAPTCQQCDLPKANGRHRVGNQGGGYVARSPTGRADTLIRSPADQRVADAAVLYAKYKRQESGLDEYGNGQKPGSTYHHLTDSRAPNRDYREPL
jgi:hypothetical protein